MLKTIEGHLNATDKRFAIVVGRFNAFIGDRLVEGAVDALVRHGAREEDLEVIKVPGAFEVPMIAKRAADTDRFDAIICLATLIRGATPHFDYIAAEVTKGIASSALQGKIPFTYGVITADTLEQAIDRAGTKVGNKGAEAAIAAIELVDLYAKVGG